MQYEPVILGIETSTDACSAAVLRGGQVLASRLHAAGSEHARELPLMVEELLAETKDFPIEAVAVSEGPGSYTGLRIGASVAKGLAYGLNVPLMAVPTTARVRGIRKISRIIKGMLRNTFTTVLTVW